MRKSLALLALATALAATASVAHVGDAQRPVYGIGGQYSAVLYQTRNTWELLPANGPDRVVSAANCGHGSHFPTGVWLVVQDANGNSELVAPSTTPLPPGSPDRIPLRACDASGGSTLALPKDLLDELTAEVGAVYIDD